MKLPALETPDHYRGLYVYDFGDWTAVGYTAEEIAILLESSEHTGGKVYRIVRATPDGQMELRGVAPERFAAESGMFFNRTDFEAARADFATLRALGEAGTPCRAVLHLADRGIHEGVARYVVGLIYPAEYDDDVAAWLLDAGYAGGDTVEGGISHVSDYYAQHAKILERQQLWSRSSTSSRTADEVLGSVRRAVQR